MGRREGVQEAGERGARQQVERGAQPAFVNKQQLVCCNSLGINNKNNWKHVCVGEVCHVHTAMNIADTDQHTCAWR